MIVDNAAPSRSHRGHPATASLVVVIGRCRSGKNRLLEHAAAVHAGAGVAATWLPDVARRPPMKGGGAEEKRWASAYQPEDAPTIGPAINER